MDKLYVAIIGKGITSRANLEALVEDYFYAKGKEVYLVLAFNKVPSQGQIFAAQYAKDKGKDIVIFCNEGANVSSFPSASVSFTISPVLEAVNTSDTVMVLWDDSDPECMEAFERCEEVGKSPYNLCEGLSKIEINKATSPVEEPEEPVEVVKVETKASGLTEAQKAEIKKAVLAATEAALQDALKRL